MSTQFPNDDLLDIALADTFPASDPPCFMAAAAVVGAPAARGSHERRDRTPGRQALPARKG